MASGRDRGDRTAPGRQGHARLAAAPRPGLHALWAAQSTRGPAASFPVPAGTGNASSFYAEGRVLGSRTRLNRRLPLCTPAVSVDPTWGVARAEPRLKAPRSPFVVS